MLSSHGPQDRVARQHAFGYTYEDSAGDLTAQLEGVRANHLSVDDRAFGLAVGRTNLRSGERSAFSIVNEKGTLVDHAGAAQSISAINDIRGFRPSVTYTRAAGSGSEVKSYSFTAVADRFSDRSGAVRDADVVAGASVAFKELRSYQTAFPVYAALRITRFNQTGLSIGYRDGTPSPIDISYSSGLFGANAAGSQLFTQQLATSLARAVGTVYTVGFDFDGTNRTYRAAARPRQRSFAHT